MAQRGRPRGFDRDHALRRAMELFWQVGYEGASLTALTTAMGITPPSLYAAFGDKEALFREAVGLYDRTEGAEADRALWTEPTARGAVREMLLANVAASTDPHKPSGCMIVLAAMTGPARGDQVRAFLAESRRTSAEALRRRLDDGRRSGELPPDTDIDTLAGFYVTVLHGLSIQARDGAGRAALAAVVEQAMRAWPAAGHPPADLVRAGAPTARAGRRPGGPSGP
ncbi:MAG: Transcriptional regulator, AcrR family [uncultured Corynebacteriales bacterium]|uniref:Transcriptional regulator, AcrR family n=1 Tax=uncultured Mycobacteriales bacterium TaxID=581187 RepID=A0A6J4JGH1_9ACTN|nr:MAG: Transcriptional regulator, AcrR family [uncultured Corynebacteriales bacterium]